MAQLTPELYGERLELLRRFYEVVLLDLGTGITAPIATFAVERAVGPASASPSAPSQHPLGDAIRRVPGLRRTTLRAAYAGAALRLCPPVSPVPATDGARRVGGDDRLHGRPSG